MTHQVSIKPVEPTTAPWPRSSAVCLTRGCGWSAFGKSTTVIAVAHDHATEDHS